MPDQPIFTIPQPVLPIAGGGLFPVGRLFCIGRNYAAHAREMGADPSREPPFFFMKPGDAVQPVPGGGRDLAAAQASACVFGYAVGLDMTRRDAQQRAKDARRPWEAGKSFDRAAPIAAIAPVARCGHPVSGAITLRVDGEPRQSGDLADMIWSVAEQIAELSRWCALKPGDLVMTGTPAGVGPVGRGAALLAEIAGLPALRLRIV